MNQNPIFILGAHKSGTSLLRNLFDGHTHLFVIPIESHFFQILGYWVSYEYRKEYPKVLNRPELINRFTKNINVYNQSGDRFSDAYAQGIFNEKKFLDSISHLKNISNSKHCIEKYIESIFYSLEGKELPDTLRIVEKSVENAEFALELNHFYPNAKFIHIVRNPYANLVSLRRFKGIKYGAPLMPRVMKSLNNSYYFLFKNQNLLKNYFIIRYEDLIQNPKDTLKKICHYVEIPFEKSLLEPTFRGQLWVGNSMFDAKFNKIDSRPLHRWKSDIHPLEVFFVNKSFPFVLERFNYKKFYKTGSIWYKMKGENLFRYLYNRVYKFFL